MAVMKVFKGASYRVDSADVELTLMYVLEEAPTWATVEIKRNVTTLNKKTGYSEDQCMAVSGSISQEAFDAYVEVEQAKWKAANGK